MQAEDTVLHNCGHGEIVEGVGEVLPHIGVAVFPEAFIIKSITETLKKGRCRVCAFCRRQLRELGKKEQRLRSKTYSDSNDKQVLTPG